MSAVSSIIAGLLPGPTPRAGFPELYAAATMPGPPVAKMVSASCIRVLVSSIEGLSTQQMMSRGSPAFSAASRTIRAA